MTRLTQWYDKHPINEQQILDKLAAEGIEQDQVTAEDLSRFDQDHYGSLDATDLLAQALRIGPDTTVLDVCSGMGGTSRYLAYRYGARVVGLDLTRSRVEGARHLTKLVRLQGRVSYVTGDACDLQFEPESFDRLVSQEAFLHIPDREALFSGCYRVLKKGGGIGYTDWIASDALDQSARQRFADEFVAPSIASFSDYRGLLADAGFSDIEVTDLSAEWRVILGQRLEMYRSLKEQTIAQFGERRYREYIGGYTFFIQQIEAGRLGGGRFVAWKK
jgi:sarcosine/dimethylglycine N-methyltransferase